MGKKANVVKLRTCLMCKVTVKATSNELRKHAKMCSKVKVK